MRVFGLGSESGVLGSEPQHGTSRPQHKVRTLGFRVLRIGPNMKEMFGQKCSLLNPKPPNA